MNHEKERDADRMSRILIIDDEEDLVTLLKDSLESKGHVVSVAYDGDNGVKMAREQPDLIILDIMMPGINGYEVCRKIRDEVLCPILFLSAKQSEMDKIKGLALGGDDYIIKPFSLKELLARINAHLRREKRAAFRNDVNQRVLIRYGRLAIDLRARQAKIDGHLIPFTQKKNLILWNFFPYMPDRYFPKSKFTRRYGDTMQRGILLR